MYEKIIVLLIEIEFIFKIEYARLVGFRSPIDIPEGA